VRSSEGTCYETALHFVIFDTISRVMHHRIVPLTADTSDGWMVGSCIRNVVIMVQWLVVRQSRNDVIVDFSEGWVLYVHEAGSFEVTDCF
jgi:hypothetical protein